MVMKGSGRDVIAVLRHPRIFEPPEYLQSSSCIFVSVIVPSSRLHVHDPDVQRRWSRAVTLSQMELSSENLWRPDCGNVWGLCAELRVLTRRVVSGGSVR